MFNLLEEFYQWGSAVLTYWQAYVTAGLLVAIIAAIEHWGGLQIPRRAYIAGAITFLVVSCFMAWRDEHRTLLAYQDRLKSPEFQSTVGALMTGTTGPYVNVTKSNWPT